MGISGLVVGTSPQRTSEIAQILSAKPNVEVHGLDELTGKIIVVIDAESLQQEVDRFEEISRTDGVVTASIVYHHFEQDQLASKDT